jgi:hypothetical protein
MGVPRKLKQDAAMKVVCVFAAAASVLALVYGQFASVHPRLSGPFEMVMLTALIVFVLSLTGWMLLKGRK